MNNSSLFDSKVSKSTASVSNIEEVKDIVNDELDKYFADNIARSENLDQHYGDLWRALSQLSQAGGKRLRPYLLVLAYQGFGGRDFKSILPAAVSQELLHISLLIHDDIIDKDLIRYGQDNVAGIMQKKYRPISSGKDMEHYANGAAILAGDLLISGAYQIILNSNMDEQHKIISMEQLGESIYMVGGGELLDMESVLRPYSDIDTIKIADLKTARYSFVTPLTTGALLANARIEDVTAISQFGIMLGIAYQLADDLLGVFGEEAETGKSTISDIREDKRTYLMEAAMSLASESDKKILEKYVGNPSISKTQANKVKSIIEKCGAKLKTEEQLQFYSYEALSLLRSIKLSNEALQAFTSLIEKSTHRKS